jgi:hypothetical protein
MELSGQSTNVSSPIQHDNHVLATITRFLHSIGIPIKEVTLHEDTFLPGILIRDGALLVDRAKLLYPGDLLHEAGHVAVMTREERQMTSGNMATNKSQNEAGGDELMAIAWSYAALVHLKLKPDVVFHPDGYKGASQWYIDLFENGNYMALPMLQWIGLCYDEKQAAIHNAKPFPHMQKWLRD